MPQNFGRGRGRGQGRGTDSGKYMASRMAAETLLSRVRSQRRWGVGVGRVLGSSGCRSGSQGWGHCCDGDPGEAGWGWGFGGHAEIVWGHSTQTAPILERPRTLGGSSLPQGALSCDAASVQRVPPESPQVRSRLGLEPPLLAPQVSWGDASSQGTGRQQVTALSWVLCDTQTRGSGEPLQPGGRDAGQGPCHLGSSPGASTCRAEVSRWPGPAMTLPAQVRHPRCLRARRAGGMVSTQRAGRGCPGPWKSGARMSSGLGLRVTSPHVTGCQ